MANGTRNFEWALRWKDVTLSKGIVYVNVKTVVTQRKNEFIHILNTIFPVHLYSECGSGMSRA